ncbi:MAG: hypothetical protein KIT34_09460 [Cyanobacteria bacterium TGS_CYA1]|nr:hypothetical protein [Cyanobacteria bacterium TGS_CYA1]
MTSKKISVPTFLALLFTFGAVSTNAQEACDCSRIDSANKLISEGRQIKQTTMLLAKKAQDLDRKAADPSATRVSWQAYQDIFKQYQQALAVYTAHRKDYFSHSQTYHSQPSINPRSVGLSVAPSTLFKPLQLKTELKCQQLVDLETQLFNAETQLSGYMSKLVIASQSESSAQYASLWNDAKKLALETQTGAGSFNHQSIQKGAAISDSVHNLIASANRDGDYTEHMKAYQNYSQSNDLQQSLFKRADAHNRFAASVLMQLDSIKPVNQGATAPGVSGPISIEQLQEENRALEAEYANLQELNRRMEEVRSSLPPKL